MSILYKLTYSSSAITIKISTEFFIEIGNLLKYFYKEFTCYVEQMQKKHLAEFSIDLKNKPSAN